MNLFMFSGVKEELASPNPGKKKPLEDVGIGEGCQETLANYSQVQHQALKELFVPNLYKEPFEFVFFHKLSSHMKDWQDKRQFSLDSNSPRSSGFRLRVMILVLTRHCMEHIQ